MQYFSLAIWWLRNIGRTKTTDALMEDHGPHMSSIQSLQWEDDMNTGKLKMCGRCYDTVEGELFEAIHCRPVLSSPAPLGMYHCPDCMAMVMVGCGHPTLCKLCLDREHPSYDRSVDSVNCKARQFSDQMHCSVCNLTWDINDPCPPECGR